MKNLWRTIAIFFPSSRFPFRICITYYMLFYHDNLFRFPVLIYYLRCNVSTFCLVFGLGMLIGKIVLLTHILFSLLQSLQILIYIAMYNVNMRIIRALTVSVNLSMFVVILRIFLLRKLVMGLQPS